MDRRKQVKIDFMYLDLGICTRCKATDSSLDEAISEVGRVLDIVGVRLTVRKTHIKSEEQARELGFVSSPTILINGSDIQENLKESLCESCAELAGGESCNCRVWTYQGGEFTSPPAALIMDAILREVYSSARVECCPKKPLKVPDNIVRFLAARKADVSG